jgi:hypothetical protein
MLRCLRWTMLPALIALSACGGGGSGSSSSVSASSSSGVTSSSSGVSASSSSGVTSSSSSGASSSSGGAHVFSLSSPNVVAVKVGPGTSDYPNVPTTSVTVCIPRTTTCTTIANVLVDTGSVGLRLMASVIGSLALPPQTDPVVTNNTIAECLPFADGFTWGPLAMADVTMGGEKAGNVPINIIDDNNSFSPTMPANCSNSSSSMSLDSITALGANGVLGVGSFAQDCGFGCNVWYYSCTASTCSPTNEPLSSQVTNPVALFAADNNGVILQLPGLPAAGQSTDTGFLVFGIGTESNNGLADATVLTADPSQAMITTVFNGQTLSGFLDSGSNGLFFADSSIRPCTGFMNADQFYCPLSPLALTATNQGQNGLTAPAPFTITDVTKLNQSYFAIDDIGGPAATIPGLGSTFDFGLPFFFGRTVFTAIEDMPVGSNNPPYFAY